MMRIGSIGAGNVGGVLAKRWREAGIDATNDLAAIWPSLAAHVAELAPGARVVKAFNASFAAIFENAEQVEPPANLVFCGDDEDAKATVAGLTRDIGLEPVDVGGLDQAANVEAFARMNV